ncbi:helix-turn-helix domain-containing protein [Thiothrix sp.]|uniref:helix-turn-helix domain-containing protein n=1 Tax=Thiothrix sp. TaxID=1032 RepID=UPI00257A6E71|nr:helix-turn-helix domain-containing protein [Thiothrix sp.]
MTETTTPVEEQTSAIQAGDLGKQLIACREKAGLDLEQAADEMHLSTSLLRSLEKEEFARLPEPPYVRGYLRGYAKFSDTDPKELIRTYEALRGANPDEIAHHFAPSRSLHRVAQQPSISPTIIKLLGVGVIVLGLGMLSLLPSVRDWTSNTWAAFSAKTAPPPVVRPAPALETFTAQKDAEEQAVVATPAATATPDAPASTSSDATPAVASAASTPETAAPAADAAATPTAPEGTTTPTASTDTTAATKPSDAATATTSDTAPTTVATASSTQDTATTAPTDSTTVSTATPAATTTTDASATPSTPATATTGDATATAATTPATTPDTAAATTADATTPAQPIAGEVNIKLEFTEDVWMQVKDGGKKTLYESLNASGSTKELKATTPLNFKVGNARGVKIYLNGQLYDQAPHTKGSVSRFKVE